MTAVEDFSSTAFFFLKSCSWRLLGLRPGDSRHVGLFGCCSRVRPNKKKGTVVPFSFMKLSKKLSTINKESYAAIK
jgi:tRNA (Thr-GGU) A37 N-methylase